MRKIIVILGVLVFAGIGGVLLFGSSQTIAQNSSKVNWQELELRSGEVAEIVIAPSDPNVMYAGFEVNSHSLYKSTDEGKSWIRVNGGGDHTKDVAVSPKDANRVYFAMSEALETTDLSFASTARSMYGGPPSPEGFGEASGGHGFGQATQAILTTGLPAGGSSVSFSSVEVFEGDDNIIYAARKGGSMGPFGGGVTPKIYKSVNRGQTWNEVEPNLSQVNVLAIDPIDSNTILIGSRDGIYQSNDSGKSLTKIDNTSNIVSIEYRMTDPKIIYAASSTKVLKSIDGGRNWKDITGPLKDIHRVRVARSSPNILYASTFNGIFRSDNAGDSWRDVSGNLKSKNIQIVEIDPTNPDIAFIGHSSLWSSVRAEEKYRTGLLAHQGIFKTEDGGKTWVRSDSGIKEYQFEEVAINPNKPYEAWILSPASRGGYKIEDGGYNFRLSQTPTFHYPMRVKYSWQNPDKIYATGWQNMAPFSISEDGGVNWTLISENVFFNGLNRGQSLRTQEARAIHIHGLAVDPKNDKIIYAGSVHDTQNPIGFLSGAHIFKSEDGGNTWEEKDEGFPHESRTAIHDITIDPQNTNTIYASTTSHESERGIGVYKSINAGESWQKESSGLTGEGLSVNALIIDPNNTNNLVIATFGGLYKSEDGGKVWRQTSSPSSFDVEYVIDSSNIVYASTQNGVLRSLDFGESWEKFGDGLAQGEGHGIGVDKTGNIVYAAVDNEGLFVARLSDVSAKEVISEFGESPYGFGPFRPGGFGKETFSGASSGPPLFVKILTVVIGIFVILPLLIFGIVRFIKRRKKKEEVRKVG